jgi:hypothetical protein
MVGATWRAPGARQPGFLLDLRYAIPIGGYGQRKRNRDAWPQVSISETGQSLIDGLADSHFKSSDAVSAACPASPCPAVFCFRTRSVENLLVVLGQLLIEPIRSNERQALLAEHRQDLLDFFFFGHGLTSLTALHRAMLS